MGSLHLTGYASRCNVEYPVGFFKETVARGAFSKTLAKRPNVVLNLNHGAGGSGLPLARTTNGSLTLREDEHGLFMNAVLDEDDAESLMVLRKVNQKLLTEMSFAFACKKDRWNEARDRRELLECDIDGGDVSIVTAGANTATSVSARNRVIATGVLTVSERSAAIAKLGSRVVVNSSGLLTTEVIGDSGGKDLRYLHQSDRTLSELDAVRTKQFDRVMRQVLEPVGVRVRQPCPDCKGTGRASIMGAPCSGCNGLGTASAKAQAAAAHKGIASGKADGTSDVVSSGSAARARLYAR